MPRRIVSRKLVRLEGIEIFLRDTQTEGPAILCLHGRWGRGETFSDLMRVYGDRFRVLAPDQRGHGLSAKPQAGYTREEMAGDMLALLDCLGIEKTIVLGHSMGGGIAGYMAANFPDRVRALAILDKSAAGPSGPPGPTSGKIPPDPLTADWPLLFHSLAEAQAFLRIHTETELGYEYFMNSLIETIEGYTLMFSRQAMAANIAHYQAWFDLLPRIACPVLLVRAKGGAGVSDGDLARMKSLIRDCRACEMSSRDHNVHLADKAQFYACLDAFLEGLP